MKKIPLFLFFIYSFCALSIAQDSIYITKDSSFVKTEVRKPKFVFDIDQRFSLIRDENGIQQNVNIWGLRLGLLFPKHKFNYKIGAGYYFFTQNTSGLHLSTHRTDCIECYANRSLNFGTVYFEPFLYRRNLWELSIPIEFGYGKAQEHYYNKITELNRFSQNGSIFPAGVGLSFSFKLPPIRHVRGLRWFGLNFLAGYREILVQDIVRQDYNGIFYSIGLNFFFDRFTDDVRTWRAKKQKKD
jgi:hypothetical protein